MAYTVNKLHSLFAAEIIGFKARTDVAPTDVQFLEDCMAENAVVVLRDQDLSDDEQIGFARHFGPLESPGGAQSSSGRLPRYLFDASNLDDKNEVLPVDHPRRKMRAGDRLWHTDSSYKPLMTKWSMLSGRIVPPGGGNTDLADTRAGYDALADDLKAAVDDLAAQHNLEHSRKKGGLDRLSEAQSRAYPPVIHPLVRTMANGRKALFIGAHAKRIYGMGEEAGSALLEQLVDHCTQRQFVYSHQWRQGDLLIWDNRCTLHRATPFDDRTYKRDMRRTTVDEFAPAWAKVG